jgi:DNA-binding response OmpR family regulator/anti-sigma regulatory factor (Ser/Thr protein kinase)
MGYSDLLDLGVKGELNPDQRGMINRVRDTSRHLLGLINEVLDLAKIGAGRIDLVMAELDVPTVIERAVQQILPLANAKGLALHAEPGEEGESVTVLADETRLTQIVINLLSNAVKFTHTGDVTVRHAVVGNKVEIRVRDTGPGIAEDQKERIFEEFYQVEGGLARSSGGTGLGLAIARRFARLMGGDIRVESATGTGAEFVVTLPSAHAQTRETSESPSVVMLARSDRMIDLLTEQLGETPRFTATTDPAMAAALTRREMPRTVLLDAAAPDHAAWRALTALQPEGAVDHTRVMLVAQDQSSWNAIDIGEFKIVTKPIFYERATDAIRVHLNGTDNALVLVADEDPHVRQIFAEALSAAGYRVAAAAESSETIRLATTRKPSAVLLSLTLRGANGVATLAKLRSHSALADVPVLMLVPRELTAEQMEQLQAAVTEVTEASHGAVRPLAELIRAALRIDREAPESLQPANKA